MARGRVVVIGGGLAAARAVEGLRDAGHDGPITIVGDEPERPYERPPLSKGVLLGAEEPEVVFPHDEAWYGEHGVELRLGARVVSLDPAARTTTLSGGERLDYDRALIATGARPRRLPLVAGVAGVHHLRRLPEALALRSELAGGGRRVVVFGSGWIGLEVAAAARTLGNDVVVVGRGPVPLARPIGAELGEVFAEVHRAHGVRFVQGGFEAARTDADDRIAEVRLDDGTVLAADVVVGAIGAVPSTAVAATAQLAVGDGVETDAGFRTSAPGVFAVGDVAAPLHPTLGRHLRLDHWANANDAGYAAGRSIAGEDVVYDAVPYLYSDQFELGMEWSGFPPLVAETRLVVRGSLAAHEFVAFGMLGGRVVTGMNVNVWDVQDPIRALIASRAKVDAARLADPDVPLEELAAEAGGA